MVPAKAEAVLEGITEETLEGAAEKAAEKTDAVFCGNTGTDGFFCL